MTIYILFFMCNLALLPGPIFERPFREHGPLIGSEVIRGILSNMTDTVDATLTITILC